MVDVAGALAGLASKRPLFHSEADFQHALAWEFHERWPDCSLRLEFRPPRIPERIIIDLWVTRGERVFAIELKHKTRRLSLTVDGEPYNLLDQSAQDLGRYDFLKDVRRLEGIVSANRNAVGCAVFLTNDSAYWNQPRDAATVDAQFRIHEGRTVSGEMSWGSHASEGTTRGRSQPIIIEGQYSLRWSDYSLPSTGPYGKFRYLLVTMAGGPPT